MKKIIAFVFVLFACFSSSCAVDFTQTDYPAHRWKGFSEDMSNDEMPILDGTYYSWMHSEAVSDRPVRFNAETGNLGFILFSHLPGSDFCIESFSSYISFKTKENGNIEVKVYGKEDLIAEHVWMKGKDYNVKNRWIALSDSLYMVTAWEGQSIRLRVNLEGDLIVEVRDYGFGWFIIFGAGNYNSWHRYKKINTGLER